MDSKTEAAVIYALAEYRAGMGVRGKVGSGGKISILSAEDRREIKAIVKDRLKRDSAGS